MNHPSSVDDLTLAWLEAIDSATACLRGPPQQHQQHRRHQHQQRRDHHHHHTGRGPPHRNNNRNNNNRNSNHNDESNNNNDSVVDDSLSYLALLEKVLLEHQLFWDQPPTIPPPPWVVSSLESNPTAALLPSSSQALLPSQLAPAVLTSPLSRYYNNMEGSAVAAAVPEANPFATFQSDDDDDEEEDNDDDEDEAGDQPILNYLQQQQQQQNAGAVTNIAYSPSSSSMVLRRIMIRVVTSLSEIYAHKASGCRQERPPKWKVGADMYGTSLFKIHQALQLADSEISRLIQQQQQQEQELPTTGTDDDTLDWRFQDLVEDANIVEVAIQYLTQERDRYRQAALKQEQFLIHRLHPQWQSRDQARARMGDEKWVQNPNPKNEHWQRRRQDEYQLRDVQEALAQLNQVDTDKAQINTQKLKKRLKQQKQRAQHQQQHLDDDEDDDDDNDENGNTIDLVDQQERRYNGQRPLDYERRVPWEDYPDPTNHGWTFTGSWEASLVEFFERPMGADGEIIKLDWYYTTATIKTSLYHPRQGKKTQLFGNRVTPSVYLEILQNPRSHTNQRYHQTTTTQRRPRPPQQNRRNNNNNNNNRRPRNSYNQNSNSN